MLRIRKEHQAPFEEKTREDFIERMKFHLRQYFPLVVADMSEEELREYVFRNWEKANSYGLRNERPVCDYLNAACSLGEEFCGAGPKIKKILATENDQIIKADLLNNEVAAILAGERNRKA